MKPPKVAHHLHAALLAAALCACSSATPPLAPDRATVATRVVSWMAKGVQQRDLLYVSNANGTVNVYTYWQHNLFGVLGNFSQPMGQCVDPAENVYITDFQAENVSEYPHGATKALKVYGDAPFSPYGCAVAPGTRNLAIANWGEGSNAKGNITIYPHGEGKAKIYTTSEFDHFASCAYDDRGDLLAISEQSYNTYRYAPQFYYLPSNSPKLIPITLPGPSSRWTWGLVLSLAWDGKYWVVDAIDPAGLYRYTINVKARYISSTQLSGVVGSVWIYRKSLKSVGTQVVGTFGGQSTAAVDYWQYPAGGSPIGKITKDLDDPFGITISRRTQ
jgi:hypothetical protein